MKKLQLDLLKEIDNQAILAAYGIDVSKVTTIQPTTEHMRGAVIHNLDASDENNDSQNIVIDMMRINSNPVVDSLS